MSSRPTSAERSRPQPWGAGAGARAADRVGRGLTVDVAASKSRGSECCATTAATCLPLLLYLHGKEKGLRCSTLYWHVACGRCQKAPIPGCLAVHPAAGSPGSGRGGAWEPREAWSKFPAGSGAAAAEPLGECCFRAQETKDRAKAGVDERRSPRCHGSLFSSHGHDRLDKAAVRLGRPRESLAVTGARRSGGSRPQSAERATSPGRALQEVKRKLGEYVTKRSGG